MAGTKERIVGTTGELFRRDRHMCAYCGGEFSYFRLTRDHITPLSRGGRDSSGAFVSR